MMDMLISHTATQRGRDIAAISLFRLLRTTIPVITCSLVCSTVLPSSRAYDARSSVVAAVQYFSRWKASAHPVSASQALPPTHHPRDLNTIVPIDFNSWGRSVVQIFHRFQMLRLNFKFARFHLKFTRPQLELPKVSYVALYLSARHHLVPCYMISAWTLRNPWLYQ